MIGNLESILSFKYRIINLYLSSIIETYLFLQVIYIFLKYGIFFNSDFISYISYNISIIYYFLAFFLICKFIKFKIINYTVHFIFEETAIIIYLLFLLFFIKINLDIFFLIFLSYFISKVLFLFLYFILNIYIQFKEKVFYINFNKKLKVNKMVNQIYISKTKKLNLHFIKSLSKQNINYIILNHKSSNYNFDLDQLNHFTVFLKDNDKIYLKNIFYKNSLSNYNLYFKRLFDFFISLIALITLLPFFIIVSILIKIDSKGPVFFIQKRHGYRKKVFNIIKFRSMFHLERDLHSSTQTKIDDRRITKFGKFIRKTNIDELPNLFNVLIGQMSIVGPRPHALKTKLNNNFFIYNIKNYNYRFLMKPGITSLSHVRNSAGQLSTMSKLKARLNFDLIYLRKSSFFLDIKIIFLTLKLYL